MTPEQRAEIREVGRIAYHAWLADHDGDVPGAERERQRAIRALRYRYDPRRLVRGRPNAPKLPCSCARVGGLLIATGEIQWRDCPGSKLTRFEWATGHTNWVHRVAAKEFLMGRFLYLRPRAEALDLWDSVTPSDPEPMDPRAVLEALGLASDPESFALKVLNASGSINSDKDRLPIQQQDRKAVEWARAQLADPRNY